MYQVGKLKNVVKMKLKQGSGVPYIVMNANAISASTQSAHSSIFCELKNLGIIRENLYDLSGELQISKTSFTSNCLRNLQWKNSKSFDLAIT